MAVRARSFIWRPASPVSRCLRLRRHCRRARFDSREEAAARYGARPPLDELKPAALDAYVRHFTVVVPPDAVAHIDADLGGAALKMMQRNMSAEIVPAAECLA